MLRAPQWHGAAQMHFPPRPRNSTRHCDSNFATRSAHTLQAIMSHDTANHPAHQRHAAFTPGTSMFRALQWHGATQTRFPSRPHKSAWHCDITDVISPHGLPTHQKQSYRAIPPIMPLTSDKPRLLHQHDFALLSGTAPRKRTCHQGRTTPHGTATFTDVIRHTVCPHTRSNPITRYRQSSRSPAKRRVYTSMFPAPQWHGAAQTHFPPRPRKSAWHCDITNVFSPHVLPTHYKQSYHTIPPIIPLTSDALRMFRAPRWHGAAQTHFPPRPRKSAWHCDITRRCTSLVSISWQIF